MRVLKDIERILRRGRGKIRDFKMLTFVLLQEERIILRGKNKVNERI